MESLAPLVIFFIVFIVLNAVFAHVIGTTAEQKGRKYGRYFGISFFMTPVVGILVLIADLLPDGQGPEGKTDSLSNHDKPGIDWKH